MSHGETCPLGFGMALSFYYSSAILSHSAPSWTHFRTDLVSLPWVPSHPAPRFSCQDHGRDYGDPPRHLCICTPPPINIACFCTETGFLFLGRRGCKHAQYGPTPHSLESWPLCSGALCCPRGVRGPSCGEPYSRRALQPLPRSLSLLVLNGPYT